MSGRDALAQWGKSNTAAAAATATTTGTTTTTPTLPGRPIHGTATLGRDFGKRKDPLASIWTPERALAAAAAAEAEKLAAEAAAREKAEAEAAARAAAEAAAATTSTQAPKTPEPKIESALAKLSLDTNLTPRMGTNGILSSRGCNTLPSTMTDRVALAQVVAALDASSAGGSGAPIPPTTPLGASVVPADTTNTTPGSHVTPTGPGRAPSHSLSRALLGRGNGASAAAAAGGGISEERAAALQRAHEDEEDPAELALNEKLIKQEATLTPEQKAKMATTASRVKQEILDTEKSFMAGLQTLMDGYVLPLRSKTDAELGIESSDRVILLSNIELIYNFQCQLASELQDPSKALEDVFITYGRFFRMYGVYLNGYEACVGALSRLMKSSRKFNQFLNGTVKTELAKRGRLDLMSYMVMPVQRVPRYVLLLREWKKHTLPSTETFGKIHKALKTLLATAAYINETKRRIENMSKLLSLEQRITGADDLQLIKPHRYVVREGQFNIERQGLFGPKYSVRIFVLMNDMILWTNTDHEYKASLRLAAAKVEALGVAPSPPTDIAGAAISSSCSIADSVLSSEADDVGTTGLTRNPSYSVSTSHADPTGHAAASNSSDSLKFILKGADIQVVVVCKSKEERDEWVNAIENLIQADYQLRQNQIARKKKMQDGPASLIMESFLNKPAGAASDNLRESTSISRTTGSGEGTSQIPGLEDSPDEGDDDDNDEASEISGKQEGAEAKSSVMGGLVGVKTTHLASPQTTTTAAPIDPTPAATEGEQVPQQAVRPVIPPRVNRLANRGTMSQSALAAAFAAKMAGNNQNTQQ